MKLRLRNAIYFRVSGTIRCALVGGLCVSLVSQAHADPPRVDVEKADRLFAEARALLASDLLGACEKFDESLRYNPAAIGTLLNVALCDEKLGRVASALAKFSEARDRAREQGLPEHLRAAEDHITALTPSVPHLTVKLTESLPSTQVVIDDQVVAPDALDDIAVDPGERTIVVTASSRLPFRSKLMIHRSEHREVVVPPLETSLVVQSSRRRIGQISTAVGSVAIATGIGIGLYARGVYRAQFGHKVPGDGLCNSMNFCEPAGQAGTERARTLGNVGTAVGLVGVAAAGIGAYLWFRSPVASDSSDKRLTVALDAGPAGLTVAAMGKF
jgi:hypothetical protein